MAEQNPLAVVAQQMQKRAEAISDLGRMVEEDPDLADVLMEALRKWQSQHRTPGRPPRLKMPRPETKAAQQLNAVIKVLDAASERLTLEQIAEETGLKKDLVRQAIYKTAPHRFQKYPSPRGGRERVWTLRASGQNGAS